MTNEKKESNLKIKPYHIIILGCLLSSVLIINSNYVNDQRAKEKLYKEKSQLFDQIIMKRYLQEQKKDSTDEICKRGTQDLIDYYQTGDLEKIDLKDEKIKCEDKDKDYMKALINLIKKFAGGKGEGDDTGVNSEENHENTPTGGRRNLEGGSMSISEMQDDLMSYGMHLLPIVVFLVIAILCIPGYLICCFCCCCNCCCCCCCKKPGCKIPCFIFTYVFYALVVAVCFYGLSQSNSIYTGLADTECSFLKFFDQILDGETKKELPRWAGISGINEILSDLYNNIDGMKGNTKDDLQRKINNITTVKNGFLTYMKGTGNKFFTAPSYTSYKGDYSVDYGTTGFEIPYLDGNKLVKGTYVLDIVKMFGKYDSDTQKYLPENSCLDIWEKEYTIVSSTADTYMDQAKSGFNQILDDKVDDILKYLNNGKTQLNDIKTSFEGIKTDISNILVEYSGLIDEYGKIGFKLVFGVLALINIAIAAFMLLICMCSGKKCTNCCCCRCICKLFTHLLWNILAILMIIVFLVGSLIALIGQVGSDFMSIISFVVSADNTDKILLDQLGESSSYLETCITGDGKIAEKLGLSTGQISSFDDIKQAERTIEETKETFNEKKQYVTYTVYKDNLLGRANLTNDELCLLPANAEINPTDPNTFSDALSFTAILTIMNQFTSNLKQETWLANSVDTPKQCDATSDSITHSDGSDLEINLLQCYPSYRSWIKGLTPSNSNEENIKNTAGIITKTLVFLENAKKNTGDHYMKILDDLKAEYAKYLDSYIDALDFFNSTIKKVTGKLNEYANDNEAFSFIQCNFIGTNLRIILKYLKSALGKDIYTVGLCFLIVGCSLMLSISSTILLIVVINTGIDKNKEDLKKSKNMSNYMLNSEGRVIRYSE